MPGVGADGRSTQYARCTLRHISHEPRSCYTFHLQEDRDWEAVAADPGSVLLDVREPGELEKASLDCNSLNCFCTGRCVWRGPAGMAGCSGELEKASSGCGGRGLIVWSWITDCMQLPSFWLMPCPATTATHPPHALQVGFVPGALNIPVSQLRKRMGEVPAGKQVYAYCQVGSLCTVSCASAWGRCHLAGSVPRFYVRLYYYCRADGRSSVGWASPAFKAAAVGWRACMPIRLPFHLH